MLDAKAQEMFQARRRAAQRDSHPFLRGNERQQYLNCRPFPLLPVGLERVLGSRLLSGVFPRAAGLTAPGPSTCGSSCWPVRSARASRHFRTGPTEPEKKRPPDAQVPSFLTRPRHSEHAPQRLFTPPSEKNPKVQRILLTYSLCVSIIGKRLSHRSLQASFMATRSNPADTKGSSASDIVLRA